MKRFELTIRATDLPLTDAGNPALPTKNEYFKAGRIGRGGRATILLTDRAKNFRRRLAGLLIRKGYDCSPTFPFISEGAWRMTLVTFASKRQAGTNLAFLDAEACLSPCKDALQYCGVLANDMRIIEDRTLAIYRKGNPGLHILLERIDESEIEDLRAHYLGSS